MNNIITLFRYRRRLLMVAFFALISPIIIAAPQADAADGLIAVVDTIKVIGTCVSGRTAQIKFNSFKAATDAERAAYVKSVSGMPDAITLVDKQDIQFNARNNAEFARISAIMANALKQAVQAWLAGDGKAKGIDLVVSTTAILGTANLTKIIDISDEILKILNARNIDFAARQ